MLDNYKKQLRKNQTDAEQLLWHYLRNRQFCGYKFRRQQILKGYIVDFVCFEKKFIVEIDGCQHADQSHYDNNRTIILEADGFKLIRFWNNEVLEETELVLETILKCLKE